MLEIFSFGALVTGIILGLAWLTAVIMALFIHAKAFVNDTKVGYLGWWTGPPERRHDGGDTAANLAIMHFAFVIFTLFWPIFWPCAVVYGALHMMRAFVRFKKKVDGHTHEKGGKVKYGRPY